MKRKSIALVRILLNIQLNHLIFVAVAVSVMGLAAMPKSYLLLWGILGIVPVGMYVLRVKAKKISAFFVGLLAILAAGFLLPLNIVVKILTVGIIFVYGIFAVRKKMSENPEIVELASPMAFVIIVGALTFQKHIYVSQCLGLTWVYLLGYFLYHFLTEYLKFVEINEKSASNMPEKELFLHGLKQVGVFAGIAMAITFLSSNVEWVAKIFSVLAEWIRSLLKYLLAGVAGAIEEESAPKPPAVDMGQDSMFEPVEYSELWLKIQKLLEILYDVVVVVIIVAIVFFGVRFIVRFVKENFTKVGKKKEVKAVLSNLDIRESCKEEVFRKEKKGFLDFLSNEQRVRTLYKKKVLKEKIHIVGEAAQQELAYKTAKECCEKMEAADLKCVYEKARYSAERVTAEDVRKAKG